MFMTKDQREIRRKLRILRHAEEIGHVARTCRYLGIGRSSLYRWCHAYAERGEAGLIKGPAAPGGMLNGRSVSARKRCFIFGARIISAQCRSSGTWIAITTELMRWMPPWNQFNATLESVAGEHLKSRMDVLLPWNFNQAS